jgi:hypothetical protein
MSSSGMLRRVALVRTDVSEELSLSINRVTRIGELGMLAKTTNRCKLQCFQIICLLVLCPDLHLHSGEVTAHILSFLYSGGFLHTIYVTSQLITSSSTVTGESALYILHTSQVLNLISIFIAWVVYPKSPSKSETNNSGATNIESYVTTEAKMCGA